MGTPIRMVARGALSRGAIAVVRRVTCGAAHRDVARPCVRRVVPWRRRPVGLRPRDVLCARRSARSCTAGVRRPLVVSGSVASLAWRCFADNGPRWRRGSSSRVVVWGRRSGLSVSRAARAECCRAARWHHPRHAAGRGAGPPTVVAGTASCARGGPVAAGRVARGAAFRRRRSRPAPPPRGVATLSLTRVAAAIATELARSFKFSVVAMQHNAFSLGRNGESVMRCGE